MPSLVIKPTLCHASSFILQTSAIEFEWVEMIHLFLAGIPLSESRWARMQPLEDVHEQVEAEPC